eukprot:s122_g20.t1
MLWCQGSLTRRERRVVVVARALKKPPRKLRRAWRVKKPTKKALLRKLCLRKKRFRCRCKRLSTLKRCDSCSGPQTTEVKHSLEWTSRSKTVKSASSAFCFLTV